MFGPVAALAAATLTVPAGQGVTLKAYVHQAAKRDAPVTLVVNGGPGLAHTTLETLAPLATKRRTLVFYDQRGTGRSSSPGDDPADYGLPKQVADIEAVRRKLGVRRVSLLGHSFGGMFVAAYAATHPSRVAALVLADAVPLDPDAARAGYAVYNERVRALQDQGIIPDPVPASDGDDCTPPQRALAPALYADPSLATDDAVFPDRSCFVTAKSRTFTATTDDDVHAALGRVKKRWRGRTLVINGADEPFGPGWLEATSASVAAAKPRIATPPGGHSPWLEHPRWMKIVQAFLPSR